MSEDADRPVSIIGIAHLFATGRNTARDAILHIACRRYEQKKNPQAKDWIVNPGRKITWRVYQRTGISTESAKQQPSWQQIRGDVLSFLEGVNVLFVCDSGGETKWFREVVYRGISPPTLVDLRDMTLFFLPEHSTPNLDTAIIDMGISVQKGTGVRRLHQVLDGMRGMLDHILKAILRREEISTTEYHHPIYSLLHWALSAQGAPPIFQAMLRVASDAERIRWAADQLPISYDKPVMLNEGALLRFIKTWMPSNLVGEDRKPFNEGYMEVQKILDSERYLENISSRLVAQALRSIVADAETENEDTKRIAGGVQVVETQLRVMKRLLFEISRRLHAADSIAHHKDTDEASAPSIYEKLLSNLKQLDACLAVIEHQFVDILKKKYLQGTRRPTPVQVVYEHVMAASERARALRRDLSAALEQFPKPNKLEYDSTVSQTVKKLFRLLGQLRQEYLTSTKVIEHEILRNSFKSLSKEKRFEERPEQLQYARFNAEAMNLGGAYAVEAGTGTGKTLGYLIAAGEHLRINQERQIVVATATKNLMDQIVRKEWSTITSFREYRDLKIAILKGRQNYLCVTALEKLFASLNPNQDGNNKPAQRRDSPWRYSWLFPQLENDNNKPAQKRDGPWRYSWLFPQLENGNNKPAQKRDRPVAADRLAWLYLFLVLTRKNGQWESYPAEHSKAYPRMGEYVSMVNAERACKPSLCTLKQRCIYPQALRRAQHADIVITNHHKLARFDEEIEKRASVCIIDEADQFPDNLRNALRVGVSKKKVLEFIRRVAGSKDRRGFVQVLRDQLQQNEGVAVRTVLYSLEAIKKACDSVHSSLWKTTSLPANKDGIRWKDLRRKEQEVLKAALKVLREQLDVIEHQFEKIASSGWYKQIHNAPKRLELVKYRVNRYREQAKEFASDVKDLLDAAPNEHFVVYRQRGYDWCVERMPFNIGDFVSSLVNKYETAIFTSATLYVDGATDLFVRELFDGHALDPPFTAELRVRSPFCYQTQVDGAVTPFIPGYLYRGNNKAWEDGVMKTVAVLSVALDGRTLVLFTNWKEMKDLHARLQPVLSGYDIPVLLQDEQGSSEAVIDEFADLEQSVLFGVTRFWTGVDFPGPTLSQLIIVRIPNAPLDRPLIKERKERWTSDQFWNLWYSPNTRRKLCQGFGRLIRTRTDKGLFVVLDSRLVSDRSMIRYREAVPVALDSGCKSAVELAHWGVGKLKFTPELEARGIVLKEVYRKIEHKLAGL